MFQGQIIGMWQNGCVCAIAFVTLQMLFYYFVNRYPVIPSIYVLYNIPI